MDVADSDKVLTLRAHRRVASNPFPIPLMQCDTTVDDGSEDYSDTNDSATASPQSQVPISDQLSFTENHDTYSHMMMQTLEIPDLCNSPTSNRHSVSIFNFREEVVVDDSEAESSNQAMCSNSCTSPEMSIRLISETQCSLVSTCTSSMESFEQEDYRGMVLREILDTERTYLSSLNTLVSIFQPALEELIAPMDVHLIFPCQLEQLIKIHQQLLLLIEERIEGISKWHGIVGDIFGRLCSDKEGFVSVYSAYMNEFKVAMQTLIKYQNTSPLFCKIANNCIKKHNLHEPSLSSFLLTPIQRLPRYELLLKQLMKHTPADHPDVYYLEVALKSLHSDLTKLDRSIQACQFASTVSRLKDDSGRKRNLKKHNKSRKRHQSSSRFARIKRHFSQANINDFTSQSSQRPVSALEKSSSFAVSEYNILEKVSTFDNRPSSSLEASLATSRAISCSEVHLLDAKKSLVALLSSEDKEDVFEDEEKISHMSHSSSTISHESIIAVNKRESVYSTNSSYTSGFDSLAGAILETDNNKLHDVGTLKPMQATYTRMSSTCSSNNDNKDVPVSPTKNKLNKTFKFSSALKVIRKASKELGATPIMRQKCSSINNLSGRDISDPTDFRHIQHGFSNRPMSIAL